jgi:geranylgeranyl diphosphate synthase type I
MTTGPVAVPSAALIDDHLVGLVDSTLADYLVRRRRDIEAVHPVVNEAAGALAEFVLRGGKRIRPSFAWWGWRGAGGDQHGELARAALTAVSALELVQANALIHDDLMDASDTRRGRPTVHISFADRHRVEGWLGPAERFGASAAILLGDLAIAWADDMFASAFDTTGLAEEVRRRARPVWDAMRTEVIGGQYLDAWCQATGDDSEDDALRVSRFKTAAYTVERPLQLGAALAGAGPELVAAYRRFGADLGVAFQLRDDLLGVFGDPAVTGKPAGDDLREGKRTLLMAVGMATARQRGDQAALRTLIEALGNPELDDEGVERAREVLRDLGAPHELEQRIERLTESALAALATVELAEPAATRLPQLADAATRRRS